MSTASKLFRIMFWLGAAGSVILCLLNAIWLYGVHNMVLLAGGPPDATVVSTGNPVLEIVLLTCCLMFGLISIGLVVMLTKRKQR